MHFITRYSKYQIAYIMNIMTCAEKVILKSCSLKNINYQIDPYIGCSHYCYYCYALQYAKTNWTERIVVHENIIEKLSDELKDLHPQKIYLGHHTDPYQPHEKHLIQTRKVLDLLLEKNFSVSILTKSDLVLRDKYLLKNMDNASVSVSVAFTNNTIRKLFEHNTIDTELRINALAELKEQGIKTNALICPVIPYVTDVIELIRMLESCAGTIWIYRLSILNESDVYWQNIEPVLNKNFPNTKDLIKHAIFNKNHNFWNILRSELELIKKERKLDLRINL